MACSTTEVGGPKSNQNVVWYVLRIRSLPKASTLERIRRNSGPGTAPSWRWTRLTGACIPCKVFAADTLRRSPWATRPLVHRGREAVDGCSFCLAFSAW